jgi:hypothetical protein
MDKDHLALHLEIVEVLLETDQVKVILQAMFHHHLEVEVEAIEVALAEEDKQIIKKLNKFI